MDFSLSKMFSKDVPPPGGKADVLALMETFRKEVGRISGVDPAHLIKEDMEMWQRRRSLRREDLKVYSESIKKDTMNFGPSRYNFFKYLEDPKNRFN